MSPKEKHSPSRMSPKVRRRNTLLGLERLLVFC